MDALLRWSITNSTPNSSNNPPRPLQPLDPGIIDAILGKPDSVLMQEALQVALDQTKTLDERVGASEDFEMLIQSIDNANNLSVLKMWTPLHTLLTSPTSPPPLKLNVLWIIGTATQNNPSAQSAYLTLVPADQPLHTILSYLDPGLHDAKIRAKAMYALSAVLKHNRTAVEALGGSAEGDGGWKWAGERVGDARGWGVVVAALKDENVNVQRKAAFLLNALLMPTSPLPSPSPLPSTHSDAPNVVHPNSHAQMLVDPSSISTSPSTVSALSENQHRLLGVIVDVLQLQEGEGVDGEVEDRIVQLLHTYVVRCDGSIPTSLGKAVHTFLQGQGEEQGQDQVLEERWGLEKGELNALRDKVGGHS